MNERLQAMRERVRARQHSNHRCDPPELLAECELENLSWMQRSARLVRRMCEAEAAHARIEPDEQIVFWRAVRQVPPVYSPQAWAKLSAGHTLHELGPISNICADWGQILSQGLLGRRQVAEATRRKQADNPQALEFLDCAIETIDAVLALASAYAAEARQQGRADLVAILERVPAHPARTFHEALQSLRLCHSVVWLGGHYHVGLGRLDQYLMPYLQADLASDRLTVDAAEELLAEFFISLNKDSDLYPGVQQGDNGQTVTLGGVKPDGTCALNELTRMALRLSCDLAMIDPKINLRISPQTDLELLTLAAELTRKGLGFPQYANDEVVIPGLVAHGYELEDARDYTVAACWEFIIPGKGMEIVNIGAVSLPFAVDCSIRAALAAREDFDQILERTGQNISGQVADLARAYENLLLPPAPYYSVLMDGCLETGKDLSQGLKYNNFGVHGAASANAADALAAVKSLVYDASEIPPHNLLAALQADFDGYESLRRRLAENASKVGNADDQADEMLRFLFDAFARACEQYGRTDRGGVLRPGTGSAMYYLWLAQGHAGMREPVVEATADGRRRGDPFSANLAPAPGAPVTGPISVLQSFSKIDYRRVCNGGPVTLELSDTVFRNPEALQKVAMLVRTFASLGCQQLQLNSLNAQTLLDARVHPERHRNLIVRVWGWSGYFCELSPEYQDHILNRHLHQLER
jgi:formate C-acetyltransferase